MLLSLLLPCPLDNPFSTKKGCYLCGMATGTRGGPHFQGIVPPALDGPVDPSAKLMIPRPMVLVFAEPILTRGETFGPDEILLDDSCW